MVKVILTPLAQTDADNMFRYYEEFSYNSAQRLMKEIVNVAHRLEQFPEMGQKEPLLTHLERNYRYVLVFRRYKIIYLFENDVCSIMMVWNCREDPKDLLRSNRFI